MARSGKPARAVSIAGETGKERVPARSIQPPRFDLLVAAAFYALCALSLAWPALTGQFLVNANSDQYIAGYAFREFAAETLRSAGRFPLWNPYLFGGMPFVAAMHGDIFYPTFLLRMALPTDVAMTWSFVLHFFLAGSFTYLFLRASGFSFFGALFGGVAYMMAGQIASLVSPGHDGKLYVSALFPLSLWMLLLGIRDAKRWSWGVLALVTGLAVLSPHPQLLQYMLLAGGTYAVFTMMGVVRTGDLTMRAGIARLGFALGAVVLGLAMGAIQYLPVREYVAWSPRAGGLADYSIATSYAWPTTELLNAYIPQFTGILSAYWGENGIHFHSEYIGAVVLVIAGAAFCGIRNDPRRRQLWFWAGVLVVALLWAMGGHTPFYRIPYAIIPGTRFFRAPSTVFFVGSMAIAFLSAAGLERALDRRVAKGYLYGWLALAGLLALLASLSGLTAFAQSLAHEQMLDLVASNSRALSIGAWRSLLFVASAVTAIVLLRNGKLPLRLLAWGLPAIAAVDSWTIMRHYWSFSPPAAQLFASDAAIQRIQSDPQPARVLAIRLEPLASRAPNLTGDGLMVHGVRTVLGYHGNQLGRYDNLLDKEQGYRQLANPNVWQLLNTRYLLTNSTDAHQIFRGAEPVAGPVVDASGTVVHLFRLPGENPYAWVTPLIVKAPDDAVLGTILDERFDVRRAALFAEDAPVDGVLAVTELPEPLTITGRVTRYEPGSVSIELSAPAPAGSALIASENFYPGWRATADGQPVPVGRADYVLTGVQLPEGARRIELVFDSAPYRTGKLITLLALALALTAIGAGMIAERRKVA